MHYIYMDSGTSNTRVYLIKDFELIDTRKINVGTKDSAISGSNYILLSAMKECYDELLENNNLYDSDIEEIWMSGMVTNTFGIKEVEHISTPVNAKKLLDNVYFHQDNKYFSRRLHLVCGTKTAQPGESVTIDNIDHMNNVRGEEIEVVGMVASGILPKEKKSIMISPGSHTHLCYVVNGAMADIVSNFTGELNYAIQKDTILGGELAQGEIKMNPKYVNKGYQYLKKYGFNRAMYIIHATKVFGVGTDEMRSQILAGIISGSVIKLLASKIDNDWQDVEKIVIVGGKSYIESYRILCEKIIPNIRVEVVEEYEGKDFALCGFFELLKLKKSQENK